MNYKASKLWGLKKLEGSRRLAHRAVQLVALTPGGTLPPDASDTSANLGWDPNLDGFIEETVSMFTRLMSK